MIQGPHPGLEHFIVTKNSQIFNIEIISQVLSSVLELFIGVYSHWGVTLNTASSILMTSDQFGQNWVLWPSFRRFQHINILLF